MRCRGDVRSNRRSGFPQDLVKKRIKATSMTETAEGHGSEAGKTGRLQAVREREERLRERIAEESHEITAVHGHEMEKGDIFKFAGLIAFVLILGLVCVLLWPYISDVFSEGGVDRLVERVRNAGPLGVLMLLGMQLLQIIVAFIPGEVVQIAAGLMYGPWLGALIIIVGCFISSAIIFKIVHALGAPFVQSMVPMKYLEKFRAFERSGKLTAVVLVLFLIPGLPKDVFTYLVPLTEMKMKPFLIVTCVARIPGVLVSTFAASGFANGHVEMSIALFVAVGIVALLGIVFKDRLFELLEKKGRPRESDTKGKR